jgi:alcohol dehydrogenase
MNLFDFTIARLPRIIFARQSIQQLPALCAAYGTRILLVTGARSFASSDAYVELMDGVQQLKLSIEICHIPGEPSPQLVDQLVHDYRDFNADVVLGIGGGSALDAAKAIAGLLRLQQSVMDFLEGVGPELPYTGPAVPFIAVPTTAGTGSEATKNAVLSVQGKDGFKKSFRDDRLVAEYAVIDPELLASCPASVIAANGMDALTQLIEAYVSTRAGEMTDALALSGIRALRDSLPALYADASDTDAQQKMAYASLMSGICLAQTGLGSVHGLASPLGAFFPIPHGVVCGTLVAEATQMNIELMLTREPLNPALDKYATLGDVLLDNQYANKHEAREQLYQQLNDWTQQLQLPRLTSFGVSEKDLSHIVANSRGSSMKTNPIVMTDDEIRQLLMRRL